MSAHTRRAYASRLNQFLVFLATADGCYDDVLRSARTRDFAVGDYRDYLKDELKYSAATINSTLSTIDHFYTYLGLGEPRVERAELAKGMPIALTGVEQKQLLWSVEKSNSARDRALVLLFLRAGLRVGECASLNVKDVELRAGQGTISVSSSRRNRSRIIALDVETTMAVREWLSLRAKRFPDITEKALFLNRRGGRITTAGIDLTLRKIGQDVNLLVSAEVLRHTCLMSLLIAGKDVKLVAKISGHKRLETTRRYLPPSIAVCEDFAPAAAEQTSPDFVAIVPAPAPAVEHG